MSFDLAIAGVYVLSSLWKSFIKNYDDSVNNMANTRLAVIKLREYLKNEETAIRLERVEIDVIVEFFKEETKLLGKYIKNFIRSFNTHKKQLEIIDKTILFYSNEISEITDEEKKELYEKLRANEINNYENIINSVEIIQEQFISLIGKSVAKAFDKKAANKFLESCDDLFLPAG